MRAVEEQSLDQRASAWHGRLHESGEHGVAASDLYAGGYWSIVRDLPGIAERAGFRPQLLVASAGYGLVPTARPILGYSATFTVGHPDSVVRPGDGEVTVSEARSQWWRYVNVGSTTELPITTLARQDVHASILVVASPPYLDAMSEDLLGARQHLTHRDQLVLVSSQIPKTLQILDEHLVPSSASLQPLLGGALASLHARTARHVLEHATGVLSARHLQVQYRELGERQAPAPQVKRAPASDEDVRRFVEQQLTKELTASRTRMLQQFRETSRACEQSRFARLFREVRKSLHASTS